MYLGAENMGVEKGDEFHTRLAWWLTRARQSVRDEIRRFHQHCISPFQNLCSISSYQYSGLFEKQKQFITIPGTIQDIHVIHTSNRMS